MSEADPPAARLAYETPASATRRQNFARRFVGIAGVTGLGCAAAVFAATIVEEQGARRWRHSEALTLGACLIAAKVLSVSALVVGIALARRVTGEERRNPLLGACAGGAGVVVLILWIFWIASGI